MITDHNFINTMFQNILWNNFRNTTILELSFKLKEAHAKVFGCSNILLQGLNFEDREIENNEYNLKNQTNALYDSEDSEYIHYYYKKKSICNINEIYRKYDASFPRIITDDEFENMDMQNDSIYSDKEFEDYENLDSKRHGCDFCNYCTNSKSHLIRHQRAMHPSYDGPIKKINTLISKKLKSFDTINRKFKCDMCQYQTDCKSHLRRHVGSVHSKEKPYQCQFCFIEFSRSEKIKEHHYNFHSEIIFDLKKSRKWFSINSEVHRTVNSALNQVSKNKKLIENSYIDSYKTNHLAFNCNISSKKLNIKNKKIKKILRCTKCNFTCKDFWHLKRHILKIHSSIKENNCKVCKYASNRVQRLIAHMAGHGELFCIYCDFSSINHQIFNKHFQVCSQIKKSKHINNYKHNNPENASVEEIIVSNENDNEKNQYFCSECPYISDSELKLKFHVSFHSFDDVVCLICNEIFDTIEIKNIHDRNNHITEVSEKYFCTCCSFQSNDKFEIKSHLLIHIAKKNHCQYENCSFNCFGNLAFIHHKKYYHEDSFECSPIDTNLSKKLTNFDSDHKEIVDSENLFEKGSIIPQFINTEIHKIVIENNIQNISLTNCDEFITEKESNSCNDINFKITNISSKTNELSNISNSSMQVKSICNKRKILACKRYGDYEVETPTLSHIAPAKNMQFSLETLPASGIFNCPHCFERPPFRYRKSFEKHMSTHNNEKNIENK